MFQYRIYPTKKQLHKLNETLEECRWLYNHLLDHRKEAYEQRGASLTCYGQIDTFPMLKQERLPLKQVHSQVLQNVAVRVDLAFKAFFRRIREGANAPGFPRFKGQGRYDSFTFPQSGFSITHDDRVALSKIGSVKMVYHRPIKGHIRTCTIRRSSTGKWYVSFSCECEPERLPEVPTQVGIDVGLKSFATLSNGEEIANPRFFRVEDLHVNRLVHNHCLAKSIADASWSEFFSKLSGKAEEAGRQFIKVNPAYTSQDCSRCHHRQKVPLSERTYHCPCCLLSIDRDLNASMNILRVGLHTLGTQPVEAPAFTPDSYPHLINGGEKHGE